MRVSQQAVLAVLACWLVLWALPAPLQADDWPQWGGPARDGVWREDGLAETFPAGGPKVLWKVDVAPGFSGPAVAGGRVFLTDRPSRPGEAAVRVSPFGRNEYRAIERVLCLDQKTGATIWQHEYPCEYRISYGTGPRATPTVAGEQVYTLGAMGDLLCLESATGKVVWHKNLKKEYGADAPVWGCACSPLVEGDLVITSVGGQGGTLMAFDRRTGKEAWRALSVREIGYSSPTIRQIAGRRQVVAWHAEGLAGLDAATGKVLWSVPFPARFGMAIATPAVEGDRVAVSCQFDGAGLFRILADAAAAGGFRAETVWKASTGGSAERTWKEAGVNTTQSPLVLRGGCLFGVSTYGELCGLDAATGKRLWTTLEATSRGESPRDRWGTAFIVPNGSRDVIFNERGELILARLSDKGCEIIDRCQLLPADMDSGGGRKVIWSHPAFADRCIFARNNSTLICASLAK